MRNYFIYEGTCCTKPGRVEITTPPADIPIDLSLLKKHISKSPKITQFDDILMEYVETAVNKIFCKTGAVLIDTTFTAYYNCFPACMLLKYRPNLSITSIKYIDTDGVQQTLDAADYNVFTCKYESKICPEDCWPTTQDNTPDAVEIEFTAGYGTDSSDVPADFRTAIYQIVAFMFASRGDCTEQCVAAACLGLTSISCRSDYRALGGC